MKLPWDTWRAARRTRKEVTFDEVLVDALNIAHVDQERLEGRIEMPVGVWYVRAVFFGFLICATWFSARLFQVQVVQGTAYAAQSEQNAFAREVVLAERGVVYDRKGELLIWNERADPEQDIPNRAYTRRHGLGQLLGYVSVPRKDAKGKFFRDEYKGISGVEETYNGILAGKNGARLVEEDVHGDTLTRHVVEAPAIGGTLTLSVDAELSEAMYDIIASSTITQKFHSGAGAIMDVHTGELIAMASYPSYDPAVFAAGDAAQIDAIVRNPAHPLLNKIISGKYIPGSIVKPFIAYAALAEGVISPEKEIYSNGKLVVPNKYDPAHPSIFRDWRAQGYTNMRRALAVSGDVYFYTVGGGFEDQPGLGITKLHEWMTRFGFTSPTGIALSGEVPGVVPNPEWKREQFNDDWRLGDTYLSSIGQFGWNVTPLEMLRAYSAIANGGTLLTPTVRKDEQGATQDMHLDPSLLQVIHEGMRMAVNTDGGTARGLDRKDVAIAGKSGTAELDRAKTRVHTWVVGYFPYDHPRYAFILFMENGPYANQLGAQRIMGRVFDWMAIHRQDMFQ